MTAAWGPVAVELDRARAAGQTVRFWLRDDDAVDVTPALERLILLCSAVSMPVLLAVIPAGATSDLGTWVGDHPAVTPCQHGYAHVDHASDGARACELGGARSLDVVGDELRAGRVRMKQLFGARLSDCLVPPWNRIDAGLIARLPALGFDRLSVFGQPGEPDGIGRLNADLDIIDWRHGRVGRSSEDVAGKLVGLISASRQHGRAIGLLTHHLAHDDVAWAVLEAALTELRRHPATSFIDIAEAP